MRLTRSLALVAFVSTALSLPGCGGQDSGQPPVGSISAEDKTDTKPLLEKGARKGADAGK